MNPAAERAFDRAVAGATVIPDPGEVSVQFVPAELEAVAAYARHGGRDELLKLAQSRVREHLRAATDDRHPAWFRAIAACFLGARLKAIPDRARFRDAHGWLIPLQRARIARRPAVDAAEVGLGPSAHRSPGDDADSGRPSGLIDRKYDTAEPPIPSKFLEDVPAEARGEDARRSSMTRLFAIYVGNRAAANLVQGMRRSTWGWKDGALDRGGARDVARSLRPGDLLVLGTDAGNPRVPAGQWANAKLDKVVVVRVVGGLYRDSTPLWSDEEYPNRVRFELVDPLDLRHRTSLDGHLLEALRMSANKNGVPVPAGFLEDCVMLCAAMGREAA